MDKLTVEQLHIFNSFIKFIDTSDSNMFILSGGAGVGKTFLTIKMIQYCFNMYNQDEIVILCPTHKALNVIKSKFDDSLDSNQPDIKFQTITKFFDKKLKYNSDGTKYFQNVKLKKIQGCIVFVDESSMINDTDVNEFIKLSKYDGIKFVFIGDYAQLEPVETGGVSLIFNEKYLGDNNVEYEKYELKQIVRSNEEELVNVYSDFRKFVTMGDSDEISFKKEWYIPQIDGAVLFTSSHAKFVELIKNNFTNDGCKIIAYRNETVNSYNKFVRSILFKDNKNKFVSGEKLIFNEPYLDLYNNNDEITVKNVNIVDRPHPKNGVRYKLYELTTTTDNNILYSLHEDSISDYQRYFETCKKQMQSTKKNWKAYYEDYKLFNPPVTYSYAITVHKSQGSTINVCFIDMTDIYNTLTMVKPESLEKTLYTAVSRASHKLYCYF